MRMLTFSVTRYVHVSAFFGVSTHTICVFLYLMISILWCLDWHFFYELPRGDDNLYISLCLHVHYECPSVYLLLPGHQLYTHLDTLRISTQVSCVVRFPFVEVRTHPLPRPARTAACRRCCNRRMARARAEVAPFMF